MQGETRSDPASVLGKTGLAVRSSMPRATLLGAHAAIYSTGRARYVHREPIAAGVPFVRDAA